MKRTITFSTMLLVSASLLAADSDLKDEIALAIQKLSEKPNYSWHSETVVPEGSQFRPGPIDGKTDTGGFTHIQWTMFGNQVEIAQKGEKAAYVNQEGAWQLADAQAEDGPGRWMSMFALNMPVPAKQATEIVGETSELSKEGDVYSGRLSEAGAKALMSFSRGGGGPTISNAKGTVKFWIKDGALAKYQYKVQGRMNWNENEMEIDRNTTVEIKDVGTTKIQLPEAAKAKLAS